MQVLNDIGKNAETLEIELTIQGVKRVKEINKIDLMSIANSDLPLRLYSDPILVASIVGTMLGHSQAELTKFMDSLRGDDSNRLREALIEEIVTYFPLEQQDEVRTRCLELIEMERKAMVEAVEQVKKMDLSKVVSQAIASPKPGGNSSTAPPAS